MLAAILLIVCIESIFSYTFIDHTCDLRLDRDDVCALNGLVAQVLGLAGKCGVLRHLNVERRAVICHLVLLIITHDVGRRIFKFV